MRSAGGPIDREGAGSRRWRRRVVFDVAESVKAHLRSIYKQAEVREVVRRPGLRAARLVAVMVVKDEATRLRYLLDYYSRIGVEHFVVVDNGSTDDLDELLAGREDVSRFVADGDFKGARFGSDWVNGILRRHCAGKWILWIDAGELLVFSSDPEVRLDQVVDELESRGQESLHALMLDMYSDQLPAANVVAPGVDPLLVCDMYDHFGYVHRYDPRTRAVWIKGGVRTRLFFEETWDGPALNKTPLVRWRRHYAFLKVAHQLWPNRLNANATVQAVLLHFRFTAMSVAKMTDAEVRRQHTAEYEAYSQVGVTSFVGTPTRRYVGPAGLVADRLFDPVL